LARCWPGYLGSQSNKTYKQASVARALDVFSARRLRRGEARAEAGPHERRGPLWFGLMAHFGPALLFLAVAVATRFAIAPLAGGLFGAAAFGLALSLAAEQRQPCVRLPSPSFWQTAQGLVVVFGTGVGIGTAVVLGAWAALRHVAGLSTQPRGLGVVALTVVLTDLVYYWVHRLLNHGKGGYSSRYSPLYSPLDSLVRWYRRHHARHHAVEALDFLRGNVASIFDTAIGGFQLPLGIIAALLHMDLAATLSAYALVLLLQGTSHVNHTFFIGPLRHIFVDNHNHKLHHCRRGHLVNFAAIFSFWDRLFGTYYDDWTLMPSYLAQHRIPLPIAPRK
jgi:sterol desaturase/sphingolipid hydroxylase (fatty acid hydroxylase superfamily)